MAELNTILYADTNKQLFVDNNTNQFILSGYKLVLDRSLNIDLTPVSAPTEPNSFGKKGNIAFDDDYIYYCVEDNTWTRHGLAFWGNSQSFASIDLGSGNYSKLPAPLYWWRFTENANSTLGDYNFINYGATFSSSGAYIPVTTTRKNGDPLNCLLNYTSNIIEPSTLNQDFTISFETKRLNINSPWNSQFILGSAFGKLGFHFEYTNNLGTALGNYLSFRFSTHSRPTYSWVRVQSINPITDQNYHQIVAMNDAYNKAILLYIDGVFQGSGKYNAPGSYYENPSFKGFGIGANPNGSYFTNINSAEYNTPLIIRNLGFWKGLVLNSGNVQALYNTGAFQSFPF